MAKRKSAASSVKSRILRKILLEVSLPGGAMAGSSYTKGEFMKGDPPAGYYKGDFLKAGPDASQAIDPRIQRFILTSRIPVATSRIRTAAVARKSKRAASKSRTRKAKRR